MKRRNSKKPKPKVYVEERPPEGEAGILSGKFEALRRFDASSWFVPVAFFAVGLLTFVLYRHTLPFPFVFDDCVYLSENPFAFGPQRFGFFFDPCGFATAPQKLGLDPDLAVNIMLRPFAYFTFLLNYLWGGLDPRGFRLVNIILHAINGCLIFLVLRHLILRSGKQVRERQACAAFVPLSVALLFVAHPLQTESVTYVIQRFTCLGVFFGLLTFWFHFRANVAEKFRTRFVLRTASVVSVVLGMLSKESAATTPIVVILLDWMVVGTPFRVALRRAIPLLATLGIVPGLVFFATWAENHGNLSLAAAVNVANRDDVPRSHYEYFLTSLRVIVKYVRLLLIPTNLNLDPKLDWSRSMMDGRVLLSAGAILGVLAAAVMAFRRRSANLHASMILAFTLYFFIALSISSGLVPLPDVMAEHRTYKPSIAMLAVAACLLDLARQRFLRRSWLRGGAPFAVLAWTSALAAATLARNEVWSSDITLWTDTAAKSPNKWRPWLNLGTAHAEHGNYMEAMQCYQKVLELEPSAMAAYPNLAAIFNQLQQYAEAIKVCEQARLKGIDMPEIDHNLGLAQCNLGHFKRGISALHRAIRRRPGYRPTHVVLGAVYQHLRQEDKALEHLRRAAALGSESDDLNRAISELEQRNKL